MVGAAAIVHETGIGDVVALRGNEVQGATRLAVSAVLHIDDDFGGFAEVLLVGVGDPFHGCAGVLDPGAGDGLVVLEGGVARPFIEPTALAEVDALFDLIAGVDCADVEVGRCGVGRLIDDDVLRAEFGQGRAGHDAGHTRADDQDIGFLCLGDIADLGSLAQPVAAGCVLRSTAGRHGLLGGFVDHLRRAACERKRSEGAYGAGAG